MKRKILSLALALMMILSVAAALPVSAVEAGAAIELEMTSAITGWTKTGNVFPSSYTPSNSADLPSWVKTGAFAMYRGGTQTVAKEITITAADAGFYDLSLAYANVIEGAKVSAQFIANGKAFDNRTFDITTTGGYETSADRAAGIANVAIDTINDIYLPEGTITVKFVTVVPTVTAYGDGSAWGDALPTLLYDAYLAASSSQSAAGKYSVIAADDFMTGVGGNAGDLKENPSDDHGWIPGARGFLFHKNDNADVTYNVYAPVAGYYNLYLAGAKFSSTNGVYSLYVNGAETADRTDIVLSTSSTADTDAQISPAIPTKLNAGLNTIRLQVTSASAGDYFYGFKLAYAGDSLNEIFLNPRGGKYSNANYIFSVNTDPTYDGMTWGAGNGGVYHFKGLTSATSYTLNFSEAEAGTYGIYVAAGHAGSATGQATIGSASTAKVTIPATGARTTAAETCLGVLDVAAGTQTIKIQFVVGSASHMNLYDIKLVKSQQYTVTAEAGDGGAVTGGGTVYGGESLTLTATADEGYEFDGWYDGETKVSSDATFVLTVQATKTYTAKFTALPQYTITAEAGEGGTVTGGETVYGGENVTLTATPKAGYVFEGWYDGATKVSSDATFVVSATATKTYTAKFKVTVLINATDMTKLKASNYYTTYAPSGVTNDVVWASGTTGLAMCATTSGVGVSATTTVPVTGWYSVAVAYGTGRSDADIAVSISGTSANLSAAVPTTGAAKTVGVAELGEVYLTAGTEYTIEEHFQGATSGWGGAFYSLKLEQIATPSDTLYINGAIPTSGSGYTEKQIIATYAPADNTVAWANVGAVRFNGAGATATYSKYVPTAGYYTVNLAAGMITTSGNSPRVSLSVNDEEIVNGVSINLAETNLSNNLMDMSETVLARVYLNAGVNTITLKGVQDSTALRVFNIKLEKEDLPESYVVRIVNADSKDVSTLTGGERIFAEVALPEDVEDVNIFLAQYTEADGYKVFAKSSFTGADASAKYSVNGLKFYRAALKTTASAGELKAFLWTTDGSFAPLAAIDVASVN